MPKVGIKLLLISYFIPESFVLDLIPCFLTFYCCIVNPSDPNSPLNFYHSSLFTFYRAKL